MVFYGSCFEPAVVDRAMKRESAPPSTSPYGDYQTMFQTLSDQLAKGPYILGEKFTAADVLWGGALNWTTMFQIVERTPVIGAYIDRVMARPAVARAKALDDALAAGQAPG
jgi:glutathione S-transferase